MTAPGTISLTDPVSPDAATGDLRYQRMAVYTLLAVTVRLSTTALPESSVNTLPDVLKTSDELAVLVNVIVPLRAPVAA